MGIDTGTFRAIAAGSMSIWIICASGAKRERSPVARSSKRTPYAKKKVRLLDSHVRSIAAVHPYHSQVQGMVRRNGPYAHKAGNHWNADFFQELLQFLSGIGNVQATAGKNQGPAGFIDCRCGTLDLNSMSAGYRVVTPDMNGFPELLYGCPRS